MNLKLDDLSKRLAGGMSRRGAFLKILGGAGALGFLGLRKAVGQTKIVFPSNPANCESFCLNYASELYDKCFLSKPKNPSTCFQLLNEEYLTCMYECESRCTPG